MSKHSVVRSLRLCGPVFQSVITTRSSRFGLVLLNSRCMSSSSNSTSSSSISSSSSSSISDESSWNNQLFDDILFDDEDFDVKPNTSTITTLTSDDDLPLPTLFNSHKLVVELLPEEATEEDLSKAIVAIAGVAPLHVHFFGISSTPSRRSSPSSSSAAPSLLRSALVSLPSQEALRAALSPARLAFGLHLLGKRCPLHDANSRLHHVLVTGLPKKYSVGGIEEALRALLERMPDVKLQTLDVPKRSQRDGGHHRGVARLIMVSHDHAEAAKELLLQSRLIRESRGRIQVRLSGPAEDPNAGRSEKPHPSDLLLHRLRERLQKKEEETLHLRAVLDQLGYDVKEDGRVELRSEKSATEEGSAATAKKIEEDLSHMFEEEFEEEVRQVDQQSNVDELNQEWAIFEALHSMPLKDMPSAKEMENLYVRYVTQARNNNDLTSASQTLQLSVPTIKSRLQDKD